MQDPEFYKRIHSLDQATASFGVIAAILSSYFNSLLEMNFKRKEAFELIKIYQKNLLKIVLTEQMHFEINKKTNKNPQEEPEEKDEDDYKGDNDGYFGN